MTVIKDEQNEAIVIENIKQLSDSLNYWTVERMKNAIPIPMPVFPERDRNIPPSEPIGGTPTNADIKKQPFSKGGKLFFKYKDKNYMGSAQFCGDTNIILTAAHCIRDHETGDWFTDVIFYRAYNDGDGKKTAIRIQSTRAAWVKGPHQYDFGFLVSSDPSDAGFLNYKLNIPYDTITSIGYPANYASGKKMQRVDGVKGNIENNIVQMNGNPMTQGSSGGAWIGDLSENDNNKNIIIGLNSFIYKGQPNNVYGPLFGNEFESLYQFTKELKDKK